MSVDRNPEEIPYYDNVEEILQEDDIVEADIRISGWNKKFRLRALTFEQMTRINHKATVIVKDETTGEQKTELDDALFLYWTLVEGVVRPKITFTNAQRFGEKNGEFVKELSEEIWTIGRVSKAVWNKYIAVIKESNELAAKEKK